MKKTKKKEQDEIPENQNYMNQNIYDEQYNDTEDDDRLTYTLITVFVAFAE